MKKLWERIKAWWSQPVNAEQKKQNEELSDKVDELRGKIDESFDHDSDGDSDSGD